MFKNSCYVCGSDKVDRRVTSCYAVCNSCLSNWAANGRDAYSGKLQIAEKESYNV